jgi:putative DNA primase/helicase
MDNSNQIRVGALSHKDILNLILGQCAPIDFVKLSGLAEHKLQRKHYMIDTVKAVFAISNGLGNPIRTKDQEIYLYNGTYWRRLSNSILERFLGRTSIEVGVPIYFADHHEYRTDIVKQLHSLAELISPEDEDEIVKINLRNGTCFIDGANQSLRDFNPNCFFTYQLPFDYDPKAKCPTFLQFLDYVLPDKEQQNILAEFLGYVFIPHSKLKLEKCMVLYGSGANGKSVFYDIVRALLGSHNISSYSLRSLTDNSGYFRALFAHKLLNYGSEISAHMDPELFKQLVSGETVGARLPYKDPIELFRYGKLMFNANTLPNDVEQNEAYFRRLIIIAFNKTIPEEQRDPTLAKRMIEMELPGVFNWVLEGLNRLVHQGKFTESAAVKENIKNYKENSDSVTLFLRDENYVVSGASEVSLKTLNESYRKYSLESGYRPITRNEFTRRLDKFGIAMRRKNFGYVVCVERKEFKPSAPTSPSTPINDNSV